MLYDLDSWDFKIDFLKIGVDSVRKGGQKTMIILSWMDWWKGKLPLTRGGSDKKKEWSEGWCKTFGARKELTYIVSCEM